MAQLGRVASYLGFFVLALCVLRRDTVRPLVTGVGAAIGIAGLLAVLSRLYPGAFPHNQVLTFFPGSDNRLNYPLNYADGTGEFLAIGLPLLLSIATGGRTLLGRALGAAAIPVAVLALVMTASRGAVITAIVALIAFYLLAPERLSKLATGVATAAGSAILVAALLHRAAVKQGLSGPLAVTQRHQMTALVVVVCVGVALVQIGITLATRYAALPKELRISRRQAGVATVATLAVALVVAIAAGVPGKLAHQWNVFKQTDTTGVASGNVYSRLGSVAGSHRYQYWTTAWHAFESKPLTGIGPGTFQFYWNQHSPFYESIINAHSLYLETLAEAGLIGFALLVGLLVALLGAGVWTVMRAPPLARVSLAGATAAFAGFCAAAGFDWVWQLPVLPIAALLLGAAIVAHREHRPREREGRFAATRAARRRRGAGARGDGRDRDPAGGDDRVPLEPVRGAVGQPARGAERRAHRTVARAVRRHAAPPGGARVRGAARFRGGERRDHAGDRARAAQLAAVADPLAHPGRGRPRPRRGPRLSPCACVESPVPRDRRMTEPETPADALTTTASRARCALSGPSRRVPSPRTCASSSARSAGHRAGPRTCGCWWRRGWRAGSSCCCSPRSAPADRARSREPRAPIRGRARRGASVRARCGSGTGGRGPARRVHARDHGRRVRGL